MIVLKFPKVSRQLLELFLKYIVFICEYIFRSVIQLKCSGAHASNNKQGLNNTEI